MRSGKRGKAIRGKLAVVSRRAHAAGNQLQNAGYHKSDGANGGGRQAEYAAYCCIALAAKTPEFRLLPVGKNRIAYDQTGVNVIVANQTGGINPCDIPQAEQLDDFNRSYLERTEQVRT